MSVKDLFGMATSDPKTLDAKIEDKFFTTSTLDDAVKRISDMSVQQHNGVSFGMYGGSTYGGGGIQNTPAHTHSIQQTHILPYGTNTSQWTPTIATPIDTLIGIVDGDGDFIKKHTIILNGDLIFSHKEHIEKRAIPDPLDIGTAKELLTWLGTLKLITNGK